MKTLTELESLLHSLKYQPTTTQNQTSESQTFNFNISSILPRTFEVSYCQKLRVDQERIFETLSSIENKDLYIVARPGGGKTLPIICYWLEKVLDINVRTPSPDPVRLANNVLRLLDRNVIPSLPQLLYLVPIQSLTYQIAQNEFNENLSSVIIQFLRAILQDVVIKNPAALSQVLSRIVDVLNCNNAHKQNIRSNLQALTAAGLDNNILEELRNNLFKALQEHIRSLYALVMEGSRDVVNDSKLIVVSIYESAPKLIKHMPNLQMVIIDEAHKMQPSEMNISDDKDDRSKQIANSVYEVLDEMNRNNLNQAKLVLVSGTINPESANKLCSYLNKEFKRRFRVDSIQQMQSSNPAEIHVYPLSTLSNPENIVKLVQSKLRDYTTKGVAFIILSKKRIKDIAARCITAASPETPNLYGRREDLYGKSSFISKEDAQRLSNIYRLEDIETPLTRQAAASGLGIIMRYDNEEEAERVKKENQIIQYYFLKGVIRVLLTTTAVQEGLNVRCRELYIPSLKYADNEFNIIDLVQLINRVGREPGNAVIYTSPDSVEIIEKVLNTSPEHLPSVGYYTKEEAKKHVIKKNYSGSKLAYYLDRK